MYPHFIGWKDWTTDYSDIYDKSMEGPLRNGLLRLTNIDVGENAVVDFRYDGDNVFRYPFLYTVEAEQLSLDATEIRMFREWLHRGGFWVLDDFHGCDELEHVYKQLSNVLGRFFPHALFTKLTTRHEMFHTVFDIDAIVQVPVVGTGNCEPGPDCRTWEAEPPCHEPEILLLDGGAKNGKILLLWNTDTGDGLEWENESFYPARYTVYAYQLMINIVVFALTH